MANDKEYKNYGYFRHKTKLNENYFLTLIDDNGIKTINLSNSSKNKLTFGTSEDNDIIIKSNSVDYHQGYLEETEYGILAVNTSSTIPMISNYNKPFKDIYLSEGSFIKLADINSPNIHGAILIMSIGDHMDEWKNCNIHNGKISLGSSGSRDIILPPFGIAKHHADITFSRNSMFICDQGSLNGTYVNGQKIEALKNYKLNNLDIIFIGNSKIIVYENSLIYQILEKGVRLDAIDIVKRVRVKFKTKQISSHVNMTINPSEFVAFIGGSGAGKSTFMKCISGVNRPTSGRVLLNGKNLYENYETLKSNIGYVPQDDIVYSNLTLYDMLSYAAKLRMPDNTTKKDRIKRIKEVLDIVQLSDFENSYIRQLSGGQRKRASIAVELIADPNLFFLDEPTSGLDPGTERSIMHTLQKMSRMGKTVILVTHNTLNLHLCDKVAFFGEGGYLCFYGTPQEALDFFEVDDFVDIYNILNKNVSDWHEKFENSRTPTKKIEASNQDDSNNVPIKKPSFIRQLFILISRYIKLIFNNIQQLLLLFLQAPIISLLLSFVSNSDLYNTYDDTKAILFSIGCSCIWLGLLNSIQEICKEKVILQKEHMADVKISTYLLSKFIVQGILAFIQAFLIVYIFQKLSGCSEYSILINPFWDMQLVCFISILSAASLGLFLSASVKDANIAMALVPLILVPQLLFSGMLFKLEGFTEFLSNFVLCRWTVEGLGSTANLNDLTHIIQKINPMAVVEAESYFTFTSDHMLSVMAIIGIMTLVLMIANYFILKKNINKNI